MKLSVLTRLACLVCFLSMGFTLSAQSKTKGKSKDPDDGIPKKVRPDSDYEKYFKGGRAPIKSNAIVLNISDPIFGYVTAGYQRKLHRHILAEAGGGPGMRSTVLSNNFLGLEVAKEDAATQANATAPAFTYFRTAEFKSFKPKFQAYAIMTYAFTGPLVNYSYGLGLYCRYRAADVEWDSPKKTGSIGTIGYGLLLQSQSMVKGPIGWGFNIGGGFEKSNVKGVPVQDNSSTPVVKKYDIKAPGFGFIASLRLTYVL